MNVNNSNSLTHLQALQFSMKFALQVAPDIRRVYCESFNVSVHLNFTIS